MRAAEGPGRSARIRCPESGGRRRAPGRPASLRAARADRRCAARARTYRRQSGTGGRPGASEREAPGSNTPGGLEVKVRRPSDIEVERELHRRGPQPHRVQLLLHLRVDPRLDYVGSEDVALEEELVVLLQLAQRLLQGPRHLRNVLQL